MSRSARGQRRCRRRGCDLAQTGHGRSHEPRRSKCALRAELATVLMGRTSQILVKARSVTQSMPLGQRQRCDQGVRPCPGARSQMRRLSWGSPRDPASAS
jgi:hypothetical protein